MKIIAFDPGETTGAARVDSDTGELRSSNQIQGPPFLFAWLREYLEKCVWRPDVVVVERFKLYPWAAKGLSWSEFFTVEVIGAIEYQAWLSGIEVVRQDASHAKCITVTKSPSLLLMSNKHALDAYKHALLYMRRNKIDGKFRGQFVFEPSKVSSAITGLEK